MTARNVWVVRALVVAGLALAVAWLASRTTWEEVDMPPALRGEAATDPYFGLRKVLAAAGSTLTTQAGLEPLPAPSATLMLDSTFWDLFPDRDAKLHAWVESGGHLVVRAYTLVDADFLRWVPIDVVLRRPAAGKASAPASRQPGCALTETPGSQFAYGSGRAFHACRQGLDMRARHGVTASWELKDDQGRTVALRVPLGRGTVTGLVLQTPLPASPFEVGAFAPPLSTFGVLHRDNALVDVATLTSRPGQAVWIIDDEAGVPLVKWLWAHARPALSLALAGLALGLWRLLVRFGPMEASADSARRSIGEQVRGTAAFLASRDPTSLHAAALRAFEAAARRRIAGYESLATEERAQAVETLLAASLHPIERSSLRSALGDAAKVPAAHTLAAVRTLERARRALLRTSVPSSN